MKRESLTGLTSEHLEHVIQNKKVLLVSPRLRSRNAVLSAFINEQGACLYTVPAEDIVLSVLVNHLISQLGEQATHFGTQTAQALQQAKITPQTLAEAFAADLSTAKPAVRWLALDDFDRLPHHAEIIAFFEYLAPVLKNARIIINGRSLSLPAWHTLLKQGLAAVIGDEQALDGGIFQPSTLDQPHIEVYGFGTGQVYVNGLVVEQWDGPLPHHLFYYFVDHPILTRDEIFETFWPTLTVKEATNVFHVTKRKISERLGYELTAYAGGFYKPSDQIHLHYDVATFEQQYRGSQSQPDLSNWYAMIKLYRGEFLHTFDLPWIRERRELLRQKYVDIVIAVAQHYQAMKDTDQAIAFFQRALREVPHREDVHRSIMGIFHSLGQNEKAMAQYRLLEDVLSRNLKIKPSTQTREIYQQILTEMVCWLICISVLILEQFNTQMKSLQI